MTRILLDQGLAPAAATLLREADAIAKGAAVSVDEATIRVRRLPLRKAD